MGSKMPDRPQDRTATERRAKLTGADIDALGLAGGVEGGMQAGSAGPRTHDSRAAKPEPGETSPKSPSD
jgi:hypothetical protein